jgi:hypothetical protein
MVGGRMEAGATPAVGSKCVSTRRIGGAERESTSVVTKLGPPASWAVHGIDGPIGAIVNVTVEPLDGRAQSRIMSEVEFEGHCSCHSLSAAKHEPRCQLTAAGSSRASRRGRALAASDQPTSTAHRTVRDEWRERPVGRPVPPALNEGRRRRKPSRGQQRLGDARCNQARRPTHASAHLQFAICRARPVVWPPLVETADRE